MTPDIRNLTRPELEDRLEALGQKPSHAAAVFSAVYRDGAGSFAAISRVPPRVREALAAEFTLAPFPPPAQEAVSADGTRKLLFDFAGAPAEAVIIPAKGRLAACLSSQSGCGCGCTFCATGSLGLLRSLSPSEIVSQFAACLRISGGLSSVVFMGMGEPFLNRESVEKSVRIISDSRGWHFPQGKITVSTVGIVPEIERLAASDLKVKLAISAVTADEEHRARLVPMERRYPLRDVLAAARRYCGAKRAQVLIEYVLFAGENDSPAAARRLVSLLKGLDCRLNLIPHNSAGRPAGPAPAAKEFQKHMIASGVRTYLRIERGTDIAAACGQLAAGKIMSGSFSPGRGAGPGRRKAGLP